MTLLWVMIVIAGLIVLLLGSSVRVINQYQRGVVLRFGRLREAPRGPGLTLIAPVADRLHKVNMQVVTMPVPAQEGITRDNVTVKVDAVVYYRVTDPVKVVVDVQNYDAAIAQVAQASLRSIIGKSDLDDLLSNRERLNTGLELMIDSPALGWGVQIDRVEIKDVALPESMKRSMSRQAEAERERRSRVITAEGELQASQTLAQAAQVMAEHPAALQLRLLQTVVEVAAEKNSHARAALPGGAAAVPGTGDACRSCPAEPGAGRPAPADPRDHERARARPRRTAGVLEPQGAGPRAGPGAPARGCRPGGAGCGRRSRRRAPRRPGRRRGPPAAAPARRRPSTPRSGPSRSRSCRRGRSSRSRAPRPRSPARPSRSGRPRRPAPRAGGSGPGRAPAARGRRPRPPGRRRARRAPRRRCGRRSASRAASGSSGSSSGPSARRAAVHDGSSPTTGTPAASHGSIVRRLRRSTRRAASTWPVVVQVSAQQTVRGGSSTA